MNKRFRIAMGVYAVLAAIAWLVLDGELLWITWLALGAFAFKTYLAVLRARLDS